MWTWVVHWPVERCEPEWSTDQWGEPEWSTDQWRDVNLSGPLTSGEMWTWVVHWPVGRCEPEWSTDQWGDVNLSGPLTSGEMWTWVVHWPVERCEPEWSTDQWRDVNLSGPLTSGEMWTCSVCVCVGGGGDWGPPCTGQPANCAQTYYHPTYHIPTIVLHIHYMYVCMYVYYIHMQRFDSGQAICWSPRSLVRPVCGQASGWSSANFWPAGCDKITQKCGLVVPPLSLTCWCTAAN